MKLLNLVVKGLIGASRFFYALLAILVILGAVYALGGYDFLARGLWGTDMRSALAMAAWVDKYFPRVPFWYPLAGGGVSITHSYPAFSFYLVSILKRITNLNLVQAFGFLGAISVPLMALGIYAFISLRFKNQTIAFLASIFYLVSPIAWTWLSNWGFYAEAVSHIFVMPTIIFWDLFFTSFLSDSGKIKNRIYLTLTVVFLSLASLAHFGAGFGLLGFFIFYIPGYVIKKKGRKKLFVRGVIALLLVGFLTFGLTLLVSFPFYRYTKIAAQAGFTGRPSLEALKNSELLTEHLLSFQTAITELGHPLATRHISFPAVVSLLAILGILISFQKARHLTLAVFAVYILTLAHNSDFLFHVLYRLPGSLFSLFAGRSTLVPLRFVLPTLAALGVVGIFKLPFFWVKGRVVGFIKGLFASLAGLGLAAFALYQFGHLPKPEALPYNYGARGFDLRNIWYTARYFCPPKGDCIGITEDRCLAENAYLYLEDEESLRVFEERGDKEWCHSPLRSYFFPLEVGWWCQQLRIEGKELPELCFPNRLTEEEVKSFWQNCREDEGFSVLCGFRFESLEEQLMLSKWPKFKIASDEPKPSDWFGRVLDRISSENSRARIDFSPYSAGLAMPAPYYNLNRDLSQIYIYTVASSSLIRRGRGQQLGVFYLNESFYGEGPKVINDLARWFGINYIFFGGRTNAEAFEEANWELWESNQVGGKIAGWVMKFPEENFLTSLSKKTSVLVVGQNEVSAYDQIFRLASYGILPYKNNSIIWGSGAIDDYTLEELENFDILLLHGYTYKNWQQASKLLRNYVANGGGLFIDTGWQYATPDWETPKDQETLEVIPLKKLFWKDLGKASDFVLENGELSGEADVSQFAPLVYGDQPWGVSTSERSNLRNWAEVVLSVKDHPLVVTGKLGEGKVVWSGMNFFSHAKQAAETNYEEIEFLTNLFSWLRGGASAEEFKVTYTRDHPDRVEFVVGEGVPNNSFLLWKEAYHPDFRAKLVTGNQSPVGRLRIYRAGPGWSLIKVPELKVGDKIIYEYRRPLIEKIAFIVSFLALFSLPVIIAEGIFLKKKSLFLRLIQGLERRLYYLFFYLWRKPFEWWQKEDEE